MAKNLISYSNLFFSTFTCLDWQNILEKPEIKMIIINSLQYLVYDKRIILYGYVIMPNHIHLLWEIKEEHELKNVQRDFLKFTAQQIKFKMQSELNPLIPKLIVNKQDRQFQFWKKKGLSVMLFKQETIYQKLNYIHTNPLQKKWQMCSNPEEYKFSSANFYDKSIDEFNFLTHIKERIG